MTKREVVQGENEADEWQHLRLLKRQVKRKLLTDRALKESSHGDISWNRVSKCIRLQSFEELLFQGISGSQTIPFTADLIINKTSLRKAPIIIHRQKLRLDAYSPSFFGHFPCPFCCRYSLSSAVPLSRSSSMQIVIRDERGLVGKIFLLPLDLNDMPINSQTIIRQKHYGSYQSPTGTEDILQGGLQVHVKRIGVPTLIPPHTILDGNGDPLRLPYVPTCSVEQTFLFGSIRLAFSFNQSATIGKSHGTDELFREHLRIVTEFSCVEKYMSLVPTVINKRDGSGISPHGQIL